MMPHVLRRARLMALVPPLLLLAACGGGEEATAPAPDSRADAGEVASAVAGAASGLVSTEGLPDFVEVYEGGTPVMHMKTGDAQKRGGLFSYSVDAPLEDVVAFHRESMKKAGISTTTEIAAQDSLSFGGTDSGETRQLLTTISKDESGVTVSQTYSLPAG
jgi:hypothetical protein